MGDRERKVDDMGRYVLASLVGDIPAVLSSAADTLRQRSIGKGVFRPLFRLCLKTKFCSRKERRLVWPLPLVRK